MVNSGVGGTKNRNLRTEVGCRSIVPIIYPTIFKCLVLVIYSIGIGTPGYVVASDSSVVLVLPRAAADMRGQYSTLRIGAAVV
jgi:hypothetical protein